MIFTETKLKGAYIIEPEPIRDERGFFARSFCQREFGKYGLDFNVVQCNVSFNKKKGTLRGMHYQSPPYSEVKLVQCTAGAIFDVAVDLRPGSFTIGQWFGVILTANNHKMFYVPKGLVHGYLTLEKNTVVSYQVSAFYRPEYEKAVPWNAYGIEWPSMSKYILSERDR